MISWEITQAETEAIVKIAQRVQRDLRDYPDNRRALVMDLTACHANGCPLDLEGLLGASLQDFSHDIYGIRNAINRDTGKLTEDVFNPRYRRQTTSQ